MKRRWSRLVAVGTAVLMVVSGGVLSFGTAPAFAADSISFTTPVPSNTTSTIVASPTSVVADGVAATKVTVTVKDSGGVAIGDDSVTIQSDGIFPEFTPTAMTNSSGVAVFSVTDQKPEIDLGFTATDTTATDLPGPLVLNTAPFNLVNFTTPVADDARSTISATTPVIANGVAISTVRVTVLDSTPVALWDDLVTLKASSPHAVVTGPLTTDAGGVAIFEVTDATVESHVTFTATDAPASLDLKSNPVDFAAVTLEQGAPKAWVTTTTKAGAFSRQLSVTGATGKVTFTKTGDSAHLAITPAGLVTAKGRMRAGRYTVRGTTADTHGDHGTFSLALTVKAVTIHESLPTAAMVRTTGTPSYTHRLTATGGNGAVRYMKTGGSADLTVTPEGVVATTEKLPIGTYTVRGRMTDVDRDTGRFSFTLTVKLRALTGATVTIADGHATTIVGKDAAADPGAKATVRVFTGGNLVTTAPILVGPNRRISYETGRLTTGKYRIEFLVGGKIVKTTIVTVQGAGQ